MSWAAWLLSGFAATAVLTMLLAGSQGLGLTRMNLPYLLGTVFTPSRDRAKAVGFILHFLVGWAIALAYAKAFEIWGGGILRGMVIGLLHGTFVLTTVMTVMPAFHPRMASEDQGPTATRQLEPPGFFALHYGYQTPLSVLLAHMVYGGILGLLYR